jgi:hypothetical protein
MKNMQVTPSEIAGITAMGKRSLEPARVSRPKRSDVLPRERLFGLLDESEGRDRSDKCHDQGGRQRLLYDRVSI